MSMAITSSHQPIPAPVSTVDSTSLHPSVSPQSLMTASPRDKQSLVDIQELLEKLFIRNRNQHRRNHWFKSLHSFRKQLGLLINELESTKKSALAETLERRLKYWDEKCIHNWYLHFTQLVPVGPFAILGLVLMACTARVCRITGITALYEEIASEDMRIILNAVDDRTLVDYAFEGPEYGWDEGEVVEREE